MEPIVPIFPDHSLRPAVEHFFNFDVEACNVLLAERIRERPLDSFVWALSAAFLFYEDAFASVIRWAERERRHYTIADFLKGEGVVLERHRRKAILAALDTATSHAEAALALNPGAAEPLFALCLASVVHRDYNALARKRWARSLDHAKQANRLGRRLLKSNPYAWDAYAVFGFSEYLVTQLPPMVRPFVDIPGVSGSRKKAIQFCEISAKSGVYCKELARIMLVGLYNEANRPADALRTMEELHEDFPNNVLFSTALRRMR
jgi:tetratricopeptide (TPR) repeat protein